MRVLGLDTSAYATTIGIVEDGRILADFTFEARTDTLEKIVTHIDIALRESELKLEDIDGFGVGLGPGSWTGTRVGVTVAKTLAFSTGKPICGISTLEVLAYQVGKTDRLVCPIISAGTRDTIYAGFYRRQDGTLLRQGEYYVGDVSGLAKSIKENTIIVSTGVVNHLKIMSREIDPGVSIEAIEDTPKGASVALLVLARFQRGESDDVLSLAPLYLKESTARAFISKYTVAQGKG